MSFAPPSPIAADEYFNNPQLAMLRAMRQQSINADHNFLAQRMLQRSNELVPLAYAYGTNTQGFTDFANQYLQSQFRPGDGGQFSPQAIGQRVQGLYNAGPGSDAYEWLREGDPEEQYRRMAALQAMANRDALPGFAQARQAVLQRNFQNWWERMLQDPMGGATGGATTWIDAFLGRATAPAATQPFGPPAGQPVAGQPGQPGSAPGQPGAVPGQPGAVPGQPGVAPGQPGAAPGQPGGAPASAWTNAYVQIIDQIRNAQRTGQRVQIGNIVYDPTIDKQKHYLSADKTRSETNADRIIRWMREAIQQGRFHTGTVQGDAMASFGGLVNHMISNYKDSQNRDLAGFWVNSGPAIEQTAPTYNLNWTGGFNGIIDQLEQARRSGQAVQIGNVVYNPSQDQRVHYLSADKTRSETNLERIIRWLREVQEGRAHTGTVNGDFMNSFGGLVNHMLTRTPDDQRNNAGFWIRS